MNEQRNESKSSIEWTRVVNPDGTIRRGYTWNPVGGCKHGCAWTMPDGSRAECYAKTLAEQRMTTVYREGFEAHYWRPHLLSEPLKVKEPAGIFLDSMSDLMGRWVSVGQIQQVLDVTAQADWHIFQLLTKNAPRLLQFRFRPNVWVGVSSPPDEMHGHTMSFVQQHRMLERSLEVLYSLSARASRYTTWMSFEPLSWDVSEIVAKWKGALDWAVIGAASNGHRKYSPKEAHVRALIDVLDRQGVPVFMKGNMRSLPWARANWRADFPGVSVPIEHQPVQMELW